MIKEQIAKELLKIKAVTLNMKEPYRYVSGILSPIYTDNRLLLGYPLSRRVVVDAYLKVVEDEGFTFDVVAGVATSGIPFGAWVAERLEKPMVYVRGKAKEHGKTNRIEGGNVSGKKVLVVEDLISTGGSSVSVVDALKENGAEIVGCIAIFNYGLVKAKERFESVDCKLVTLTDFETMMSVAESEGYLSSEDASKALAWNKNPSGWGKEMGFE